jgi:hypothetical protein
MPPRRARSAVDSLGSRRGSRRPFRVDGRATQCSRRVLALFRAKYKGQRLNASLRAGAGSRPAAALRVRRGTRHARRAGRDLRATPAPPRTADKRATRRSGGAPKPRPRRSMPPSTTRRARRREPGHRSACRLRTLTDNATGCEPTLDYEEHDGDPRSPTRPRRDHRRATGCARCTARGVRTPALRASDLRILERRLDAQELSGS